MKTETEEASRKATVSDAKVIKKHKWRKERKEEER